MSGRKPRWMTDESRFLTPLSFQILMFRTPLSKRSCTLYKQRYMRHGPHILQGWCDSRKLFPFTETALFSFFLGRYLVNESAAPGHGHRCHRTNSTNETKKANCRERTEKTLSRKWRGNGRTRSIEREKRYVWNFNSKYARMCVCICISIINSILFYFIFLCHFNSLASTDERMWTARMKNEIKSNWSSKTFNWFWVFCDTKWSHAEFILKPLWDRTVRCRVHIHKHTFRQGHLSESFIQHFFHSKLITEAIVGENRWPKPQRHHQVTFAIFRLDKRSWIFDAWSVEKNENLIKVNLSLSADETNMIRFKNDPWYVPPEHRVKYSFKQYNAYTIIHMALWLWRRKVRNRNASSAK